MSSLTPEDVFIILVLSLSEFRGERENPLSSLSLPLSDTAEPFRMMKESESGRISEKMTAAIYRYNGNNRAAKCLKSLRYRYDDKDDEREQREQREQLLQGSRMDHRQGSDQDERAALSLPLPLSLSLARN